MWASLQARSNNNQVETEQMHLLEFQQTMLGDTDLRVLIIGKVTCSCNLSVNGHICCCDDFEISERQCKGDADVTIIITSAVRNMKAKVHGSHISLSPLQYHQHVGCLSMHHFVYPSKSYLFHVGFTTAAPMIFVPVRVYIYSPTGMHSWHLHEALTHS